MSKTKFVPDRQAIGLLSRSREMLQVLEEKARDVASIAKGISPVLTSSYRDGIESTSGIDGGKGIGRVNANDWKSHFVEFGTSDTPTFAPLRKAAERSGLRVIDKR